MSEDNGEIVGSIGQSEQEENVTHAPNAIGPNVEFAISPQGLIRAAFAQGLIMSAFYCDSEAARIISTQFAELANKLDEAHEQLRALNEFSVIDTVEEDDQIQEAVVVQEPEPIAFGIPDELEEDNSLS